MHKQGSYIQKFTDNSRFGIVKIRQGYIPSFPDFFFSAHCRFFQFHSSKDNMNIIAFQKNMRSLFTSDKGVIRWQAYNDANFVGYIPMGVLILNTAHGYMNLLKLAMPESPQIIQLNSIYYLFFLKNSSKLQIFNFKTKSFEQTIILPKNQGWLTMSRIHQSRKNKKPYTYLICLKGFRYMRFYELNVLEYPFLKKIQSIDMLKEMKQVFSTLMNEGYVCNFINQHIMDEREILVEIISRFSDKVMNVKFPKNDIIHLVNLKTNTQKAPLFIRFSDQKLDLVTFKDDHQILIDLFKNFNKVNNMMKTTSTVTSIYTEELSSIFVIFILRKDNDNRGLLFRISIPRCLINNIFKYIDKQSIEQILKNTNVFKVKNINQNQQEQTEQEIPLENNSTRETTLIFQTEDIEEEEFSAEPEIFQMDGQLGQF
eukprot:403343507